MKEDLESIKHLRYSNVVNSVGMLRLANTVAEQTNDKTQCYVIYRNMTMPGIFERFYKTMQNRLGLMMTKADVTSVKEDGDHVVVSCANTLLGMDFDLDCDLVVLPTGIVPVTAKDAVMQFEYRQGPDFPDLDHFDGYVDSNYICFPYETPPYRCVRRRLCASAHDPRRLRRGRPRCRAQGHSGHRVR